MEQVNFGMPKLGPTKVCQTLPWHLRVRSHFLGVICSALGMHIHADKVSASIQKPPRDNNKPPRNDSNQSKARRKSRSPFTVYCCCATIWEFRPKFPAVFKYWGQIFSAANFVIPKFACTIYHALPGTTLADLVVQMQTAKEAVAIGAKGEMVRRDLCFMTFVCPQVGGHLYSGSTDPWTPVRYSANANGGACIAVTYPYLNYTDVVGRAVVIHAPDGTRVACGIIGGENGTTEPQTLVPNGSGNFGDQTFCSGTTSQQLNVHNGNSGGAFACNCATSCALNNPNGRQDLTLTTYTNTGPLNRFVGVFLQITSSSVTNVANAVFDLDANSGVAIQSGGTGTFSASSTFRGSGQFQALRGSVVSFTAAAVFEVASTIAGTFSVGSASALTFQTTVDFNDAGQVDVGSGSSLVASAAATVSAAARVRATSGTMRFLAGLAMTGASSLVLEQSTMEVSTWDMQSSSATCTGATVTSAALSVTAGTFTTTSSSFIVTSATNLVNSVATGTGTTMTLTDLTATATSIVQDQGSMTCSGGLSLSGGTMRVSNYVTSVAATFVGAGVTAFDVGSGSSMTVRQMEVTQTVMSIASGSWFAVDGGSALGLTQVHCPCHTNATPQACAEGGNECGVPPATIGAGRKIPFFRSARLAIKIHLRERWRGCGKMGEMGLGKNGEFVPNCPIFLPFSSRFLPISHIF